MWFSVHLIAQLILNKNILDAVNIHINMVVEQQNSSFFMLQGVSSIKPVGNDCRVSHL